MSREMVFKMVGAATAKLPEPNMCRRERETMFALQRSLFCSSTITQFSAIMLGFNLSSVYHVRTLSAVKPLCSLHP